MDINNLTFGQIKELTNLIRIDDTRNKNHRMIGKYCIARCYSAGVHAGEVVEVDGENIVLINSRRLWSWRANDGVALSGVAQNGLDKSKSKVDALNPEIYLTGVCELIPCSSKAKESINE